MAQKPGTKPESLSVGDLCITDANIDLGRGNGPMVKGTKVLIIGISAERWNFLGHSKLPVSEIHGLQLYLPDRQGSVHVYKGERYDQDPAAKLVWYKNLREVALW